MNLAVLAGASVLGSVGTATRARADGLVHAGSSQQLFLQRRILLFLQEKLNTRTTVVMVTVCGCAVSQAGGRRCRTTTCHS